MNYADFSTEPPYHGDNSSIYFDNGQGIPKMTKNNITQSDIYKSGFLLTQEHHREKNRVVKDAKKELGMDTEVSRIFFSDKNIKRIQKKIKQEVFTKTKGKFRLEVEQDEKDLIIVMSAVYKLYARHLNEYPIRQVKKLNEQTVDYLMPDLISNIKTYYGYLKEINEPRNILERPINVNNAGRKTLPSVTTTFGFR